ncbi:hypothetical protein SAMN06295879_2564 [Agreia bicolorata]|uniref:Uncharacterized protein n=2 Tax=Agreia bicolorata TaxID=110935 RepID=A0A1T4YAL1_9MICO|nr:hypothetical protein [Agreia bicolorata]SKA98315.1 hypothetical protein SAMN06295879_2564 [Agreia bicolorata]
MSTPSDASTAAAHSTFDESIDDTVFDMVSSTASAVSTTSPSRFHYREDRGVIWGEYTGDTVSVGRFSGYRERDVLHVSFVHLGVDGSTTAGSATSVVSRNLDGVLELTEDFVGPDGGDHVSVCREVRA